jgi:hypothetical protein
MTQKKVTQVDAKDPVEEKDTSSQQEEKETPAPAKAKQPVACFFTADGVRVNSENQRIDEYGTILDEKPLLRG